MRSVALFIATGGYSGYVPVAPGTAGSAVGLALYALVRVMGGSVLELLVLLLVVVTGIWAATVGERHFQQTDPGAVVIDEVAGMLVTLLWIPVTWQGALVGFVMFRLFDIVKPFPARSAERLPGGWGVMTDDLVAGAYAHLTVRLFGLVVPVLMVY